MDFFLQVSKELDQQVASLVRTISRRGVSQIQSSDEAMLLQLVTTLATISQTARDSFVWRCGLVTVCGDDPGVLMPSSVSSSPSSPLSNEDSNNNNNISSSASVKITPLDSRISVISRLTDLLSLVYVAHSYFSSSSSNNNSNNGGTTNMSDHQTVFKKNHIVTFLAVVAGACDVPFLPQGPLCSVILETLNSCLHDFLGVVHAEHSVNNAIVVIANAPAVVSKNGPIKNFDQTKFPRKLPFTFSIHAHRYLLKSLSRRIFQPLYASWLISTLGSPENLTPFPGNNNTNNNNNISATTTNAPQGMTINNPFSSSSTASLMRTTQAGANLSNNNNYNNTNIGQHDDDADFLSSSTGQHDADDANNNGTSRMRMAQSGMNGHSCFLKDAIIRIICGGFLGDGPVASPHSYVAVALNVLSTLLLIPLEDGNNNNNNGEIQKTGFNGNSNSLPVINEDHNNSSNNSNNSASTNSLVFDKRAPQIFGARSVDGMSTIIEALIRRNLFRGNNNNNNNVVTTSNNQGLVAAASLLNLTSVSAVKRLMKFFWTLRPLIQSLSTCSITRKAFMNAASTKNLFDLLWKTINAMIEAIDSILKTNDGNNNNQRQSNNASNVESSSAKQQKIFQAVSIVTISLLPIAVGLWRGMNLHNNNDKNDNNNINSNRGFSDTIFLFAQRAASILIPPPIFSSFQPTFFSSYRPTSQENIIAFDSLVHAVEFASSIETTPVLKNWLSEASSDVCSIHTTSTSSSSSSSSSSTSMKISAARHIQLQWGTLLIALGIEDTILRCVFSSAIGISPESDLPAHLMNLLQLQQQNERSSSSSSSTIMMIVLVDTALRDAVSQRIERKTDSNNNINNNKISSPDMIFGALSAVGGSPLNNPNQNDADTNSSSPAHPVLRRALLRLASLAADEVSCKDVCRVLLRSNQGIGFISWISNDENSNNNNSSVIRNDESYSNNVKNIKSSTGLQVQEDSAVVIHNNYINNNNSHNPLSLAVISNNNNNNNNQSSSGAILSSTSHQHQQIESGLTASLRIELAQQKSLNFDLERELQRRSNEATIQDAKIRALHETLNSMETDNNQQKVATDTIQEILDTERQQKMNAMANENNLRHEMAVMAQRLRELEQERMRIQNQAQSRIDEAERRANAALGRLNGVERELEGTREQLVVSEDRVNKFVALHNTFAEMTRTV